MHKFMPKLVWIMALLVLFSAAAVLAQTSNDATQTSVSSATATAQVIDEQLSGIAVEEVTAMPSRWGLLWRNVKERVAIATTFDPVKKAEKRLEYAEENMKIVEYIANNAKDTKVQAWAQKRVERANEFMEEVEETKDKWINHPLARQRQLLKNVATHEIRKEKILDRLEDKIPADKLEALQKLRVSSIENSQRLIKAINNVNISTSTREHLQAVKARIDNHLQTVREYQTKKQELLQKAKSGDESAKAEIQKLNEARKTEIKANVEKYKEARTELKERADAGSQAAKEKLKVLNKARPTLPAPKPLVRPATSSPAGVKPAVNKVLPAAKQLLGKPPVRNVTSTQAGQ